MTTAKSNAVWLALTAAVLGFEAYTLRRNHLDSTLTRTTRRAFRTHHPYGKAAFALAFGSFSVWMITHILESDHPMDIILNGLKGDDHADES